MWDSAGVDLNRNYGFKWGLSNTGSSPNSCDEDYRGPQPFSEPETQNIKGFVDSNAHSLKMVFNLHCYGNLFIHPFNYDNASNLNFEKEYPSQKKLYETIWDIASSAVPGMIKGNGAIAIKYDANGEASDWILG